MNVEVGQSARGDVQRGMRAVLSELGRRARGTVGDELPAERWPEILERHGGDSALNEMLTVWAEASLKPLVLLIDEIDSLVGDTLIAVLRQLRAGV